MEPALVAARYFCRKRIIEILNYVLWTLAGVEEVVYVYNDYNHTPSMFALAISNASHQAPGFWL